MTICLSSRNYMFYNTKSLLGFSGRPEIDLKVFEKHIFIIKSVQARPENRLWRFECRHEIVCFTVCLSNRKAYSEFWSSDLEWNTLGLCSEGLTKILEENKGSSSKFGFRFDFRSYVRSFKNFNLSKS